jgi:hypothetical protein
MKRNETSTNAGVPEPRTIFQRQQAASGYPLFDDPMKTHMRNQHERSSIPRELGRQKMAISLDRAGTPSDDSKPPVMPAFVQRKLKAAKETR